MTDLHTLASMVEAATGPSRALDHAIAVAIGERASNGAINVAAMYTRSLDVAMTLADDGKLAELLDDALSATGIGGWKSGEWRERFIRNFVAAALRALATQGEG